MSLLLIPPRAFTVNASNSGANTPAINLNNDYPQMVWRSANLTTVYVTIQTDGASWNSLALVTSNLRATDSVRVRAATTAANTTAAPTYDSGNTAAFSGAAGYRGSNWFLAIGAARTETFIRVDITSTGNPAGFVEAARLVYGTRVEFGGIDNGAEYKVEDSTEINTYRGFDLPDPYDEKMSVKFTLTGLTEVQFFETYVPFLRSVGTKRAVLFIPDDTTPRQNEMVFGRVVEQAQGQGVSYDFWKVDLKIREC